MRPRLLMLPLAAALCACGTPAGTGDGGSPDPDGGGARDGGTSGSDGGDPNAPRVDLLAPAEGEVVLETAVVRAKPSNLAPEAMRFFVEGEASPRCERDGGPWTCLLHLDAKSDAGTVALRVDAILGGQVAASAAVTLRKQSAYAELPCASTLAVTDCAIELVELGAGAGWAGVTYENRDGLRANVDTGIYPGMSRVENSDDGSRYGTSALHRDGGVVLGNASAVYLPPGGSISIPRSFSGLGMLATSRMWRENKMFWWPEHRDHGKEDYFHFLHPGIGVSQGTSGTELDEIRNSFAALGAMAPPVRAKLEAEGLVWQAVMWTNRKSRAVSDAELISDPQAHVAALIDADNGRRMLELTRGFRPDRLPPVARVAVVSEDFPSSVAGTFTTEESVTRTWHQDGAESHTLVLSAAPSVDVTGRALTFHWSVLRAKEHVTVEPLDDAGREVKLTFTPNPLEPLTLNGLERQSHLAAVALFVHNGLYFSLPAFVTVYGAAPMRPAPDSNNLD